MMIDKTAEFVGKHFMLFLSVFIVAPVSFILVSGSAGKFSAVNERCMFVMAYIWATIIGLLIDMLPANSERNKSK